MRSPVRLARYEEPRSRVSSPPRDTRDYRRRSPSPRRDRIEFTSKTWKRRSPSPAKPGHPPNEAVDRESATTSRRSSPPPIHPSRAGLVDDRPTMGAVLAPRSPPRERERSPPRRRETPPTGPRGDREFAPPTGPASSYRTVDSNFPRAPPTGPSSRSYPSPAISPSAGPNGSTQPPAHPRSNNPVLAAPSRPRGGGGGRGGFPYDASSRRGSWGGAPRGGFNGGGAPSGPRGPGNAAPFAPTFRGSSNSSSTTYPRTQRFNHLADLPKEVPGGQKLPEVFDKSKLLKLEEDARKLRELIEKREDQKRPTLREWDTMERDSAAAHLRVELAETSLRELNGEGDMSSAF
jgi:hypothetical protein